MNDKSGRRLFKAGALWLLILGAVHSTSLFIKQVPANDIERQILDLMTSYRFNLTGSLRSMSDLMRGFSVAFMLAPLAFGVLDLMLSRERAGLLKRVALVQIIWLAAMIVVALRYFFAVPLSFLVVALLIFALAWLKLPADASN
jgi:hypothetical protein